MAFHFFDKQTKVTEQQVKVCKHYLNYVNNGEGLFRLGVEVRELLYLLGVSKAKYANMTEECITDTAWFTLGLEELEKNAENLLRCWK